MRRIFGSRSDAGVYVAANANSWRRRVVDYCWRWPPAKSLQWGGGGLAAVLVLLFFWPWILGAAVGMGLYHLWERRGRK